MAYILITTSFRSRLTNKFCHLQYDNLTSSKVYGLPSKISAKRPFNIRPRGSRKDSEHTPPEEIKMILITRWVTHRAVRRPAFYNAVRSKISLSGLSGFVRLFVQKAAIQIRKEKRSVPFKKLSFGKFWGYLK